MHTVQRQRGAAAAQLRGGRAAEASSISPAACLVDAKAAPRIWRSGGEPVGKP